MKTIKVLSDYDVEIFADTSTGVCGAIWQIAYRVRTPVGYLHGSIIQPSELRPLHWELQIFLRSDIRYDELRQVTEVDIGSRTKPHLPHFHRLLPKAIAEIITQSTSCRDPVSVTVHLYQIMDTFELGNTWSDVD